MFFPESLYLLSPRDQQVTWLDPLLDDVAASNAAAQLTVPRAVPTDRALLLQSTTVSGEPGAGQNVTLLRLELLQPGGTVAAVLAGNDTDLAANVIGFLNWTGSIVIPPGWSVQGRADFNAGVAVNSITINVFGLLVPIGNIQRL